MLRLRFILGPLAWLSLAAAAHAQAPASDTLLAKVNAFMQAKNYDAAAGVLEQMTRRDPSASSAWVRLGIARQMSGKIGDAIQAYRTGIAHGAGGLAQYNLGTAFALQHSPDSAFHWLTTSVHGGFSNAQALENDTDLTGLHADARWPALVDSVKRAAQPCMYRKESRAFDFWVGDWNVTTPAGQPAGTSSVKLLLNGCALYENWSAGGNGDGKSLNSYNPDTGMWQQFWTDQTGRVTEYRTSEWIDGSLRYTARVDHPSARLIHMTFTPVNKDLVRQFGEVSTDGGKTWTLQYDLYYHRRAQ